MNKEIISKFKQSQPIIWQYIYSTEIKKIEKMHDERLQSYLAEKLNSSKTETIYLSFLFRLAPLVRNAQMHGFFSEKGLNILRTSKSQRLKCCALYYFDKTDQETNISEKLSDICKHIILSDCDSFQAQFLSLDILKKIDLRTFLQIAEKMSLNEDTKLIFLKKKIIKNLIECLKEKELLNLLLENFFNQKEPFVQQAIAENLSFLEPQEEIFKWLKRISEKSESAVICTAVKSLLQKPAPSLSDELFLEVLNLLKLDSKDIQLFTINTLTEYMIRLRKLSRGKFFIMIKAVIPIMDHIAGASQYGSSCKIAKLSLERLWIETNDSASNLYYRIIEMLKGKKRSGKIRIPADLIKSCNEETLGRVLSIISQENYSIQLIKSPFRKFSLVKDAFFKFRLWRLLYEIRNPSTTKRQSWENTIGRHFTGRIRSASSILSEQSQTAVPGEVVFNEKIPHSLPLIDDFISASEASGEYKIFSADGATVIKPPQNIFKKLSAELNIAWNFRKYSDKRNRADSSYLESFRKMGYEINLVPYTGDSCFSPTPSVLAKNLFGLPLTIPVVMAKCVEDFKNYFITVYSNTIRELSYFLIAFISYFALRHIVVNSLFRHYRKSFSLCIGGWGTRGKSSVERLKTALFISLGFNVFGKTTGSEAAFTYSMNGEGSVSIPIFRPYGKTTIWEQLKFVRLASKMKTEVFLWECMAISPKYVKIMQRSWMRDDIATITNTYPDHEDHQGPAGWNVAETMTNFVPEDASLITAENQMYPFLRDECEGRNSVFRRVKDYDSFILTSDILRLFPYKEHPGNIALVLKLAEELGIDSDVALKGIIDNIKPDIGVLKEYPPLESNGKKITFISGMSANEKAACLYNWNTMKMNEQQKDVIRAVLINNRVDRPARSKVFADLVVNDLNADLYFLAGKGLDSFIANVRKLCSNDEALLHRFIIIKNPDMHPLELFKIFALHIPEGKSMRIMGIQNIKGIGINICRYLECPSCGFKIKKKPSILLSSISGFFDPLRMVFRKRKANSIYKSLSKKKIDSEYAVKILNELSE